MWVFLMTYGDTLWPQEFEDSKMKIVKGGGGVVVGMESTPPPPWFS